MKLPPFDRNMVSQLNQSVRAWPQAPAAAQQTQPAMMRDGFEGPARAPPVDLGRAAEGGSNADYVKGLYKQLLGREPDAAGMAAHLKGLETGMSKKDILNVFMNSPEFKAKQAGAASGAAGDLSATNRSFGTPVKASEDPGTVSYVNSPENKHVAPPSVFADAVNQAIDRVQAQGIGIDPNNPTRITDFDKYHQAVCQEMLNAGYQAHYDGEELGVGMKGDKHSEQFDISTWKGEVRRFYASSQTPPVFAE